MINTKYLETIKRYTDNKYLTKHEIREEMGNDFEEIIWLQTREYRERYKNYFNLTTASNNQMLLHITPGIISKEIQLHKDITQLGLKSFMYERLTETLEGNSLDEIKTEAIISETLKICNAYSFKVNTEILLDIVNGKLKANDDDHHFGAIIFEFLSGIYDPKPFSSTYLIDLNKKFYRNKNIETVLRTKNIFQKSTTVMTSYAKNSNFLGFENYELRKRLSNLDKFLSEYSETNTFIKAMIVYYYIKYGRFFEKYNEASAICAFYLIIASEYPDYTWLMSFGTLLVEHYESIMNAFNNSENNGSDISYLLHVVLKTLHVYLDNSNSTFDAYISAISKRNKERPKSELSQSIMAKKIQEANPRISKKQASFFVSHKDGNKYYSIKDFQDFNRSSYETSRYSLDNLVNEGFYEKKKVGKKFVYKVKK